jgi:hypothetical protein
VIALTATGFGSGGSSDAARAAPSSSTVSPRATQPSASTPLTPSPTATASTPTAPPLHVVRRLVAARADAWTSGDIDRLEAAEVKGSPAYQRDVADLRTAARKNVRYRGLRFTVRSAAVEQSTGDVVHVSAVIDSSAYQVVGEDTRRVIPARSGQHTDLSVRWTNHGWRVVDWAAPH